MYTKCWWTRSDASAQFTGMMSSHTGVDLQRTVPLSKVGFTLECPSFVLGPMNTTFITLVLLPKNDAVEAINWGLKLEIVLPRTFRLWTRNWSTSCYIPIWWLSKYIAFACLPSMSNPSSWLFDGLKSSTTCYLTSTSQFASLVFTTSLSSFLF